MAEDTGPVPGIQRCINLGNMLEAPREGAWGLVVREPYLSLIAEAGFDTVRLPVRWSAHALAVEPYTINPAFFERVDEVIGWALAADLNLILNIHHYEEIMQAPAVHTPRLLALWDQIATRYADYPDAVIFEALNEPTHQLTESLWNDLQPQVVDVIRRTNPQRTIVVGGANWNSLDTMLRMQLPEDDHLMATFHYYDPFPFTHQGAEWSPDTAQYLGTTWGTDFERAQMHASLMRAADWQTETGVPVLLGEFGAYSKADMPSRLAWTSAVRQSTEELGMAWCYWEFASGFGIFDRIRNRFNELYGALIPDREPPVPSR